MEANVPPQKLASIICPFSQNLIDGSGALELVTQAAADTEMWHQLMEHLNHKSLDLLKKKSY